MTWTAPMTWVDGAALPASQLNTHLRDNLMETMPARATEAGQFFVTDAKNHLVARLGGKNTITTNESTKSTEYTDLATTGPQVTLVTGGSVLIFFGAQLTVNNSEVMAICSVQVVSNIEGGNTIEPDDSYALVLNGAALNSHSMTHHVSHINSVTPGSNTFTMKYRTTNDATNADFSRRRLSVMPLT